jgi:hypothetical protein
VGEGLTDDRSEVSGSTWNPRDFIGKSPFTMPTGLGGAGASHDSCGWPRLVDSSRIALPSSRELTVHSHGPGLHCR